MTSHSAEVTIPPSLLWPRGRHPLHLLEVSLPTVAENVALDEALLIEVANGAEGVLRLWESPQVGVVLGRSNHSAREFHHEALERDGVPMVRRHSGGGSVVVGPGCLMFSLVLPVTTAVATAGISAVTRAVLQQIAAALTPLAGAGRVEVQGISDLVLAGDNPCKFSGNAQRWVRTALLHHGTILYNFPLELVTRYLQSPPLQPDYRADRPHHAFIVNFPAPRRSIEQQLAATWGAIPNPTRIAPLQAAAQLCREKYSSAAWTH